MTTTPTADQVFYRAAPVTDIDEDARQYTAIGVPFGQVTNHEFGAENFEAGSVRDPDDGAPAIFDEHREPIGYVLSSIDTPAGRKIRVQISDTVRGRDVWTLIKDRVYRSMSIGFRPVAWRLEDDGVITFTEVIAYEYSTAIRAIASAVARSSAPSSMPGSRWQCRSIMAARPYLSAAALSCVP